VGLMIAFFRIQTLMLSILQTLNVENICRTGALCARLSGDAAKVQGATGARVGSILQGISGIIRCAEISGRGSRRPLIGSDPNLNHDPAFSSVS
jgi:hypothetical protein